MTIFFILLVLCNAPFILTERLFLCCSGNESIIVYACDCSNEALERAKEMINSTDIISSATHRFQPFCCDFSTNGFPEWLACNLCREKISPKQHVYISGCKLYTSLSALSLSLNRIWIQYFVFFFVACPDVNQNSWRGSNYFCPLRETNCCIGGVDFISLVCAISQHLARLTTCIIE